MSQIINHLGYFIVKWLIIFFGLLPTQFTNFIARKTADYAFKKKHKIYRKTLKNINDCYPKKTDIEKQELSKQCVEEVVKNIFSTCNIWISSKETNLKKIHAAHNIELLEQAVAKNKGVILIAPHIGSWEMIPSHITNKHKLTAMYEVPKQDFVNKLLLFFRQTKNMYTMPASSKGIIRLLKTLKSNEVIAILPDQTPNKLSGGIMSPFMGKDALTMNLIYKLIQKTGAQAVACCAIRSDTGYEIHYIEPSEALYSTDEQTSVDALNKLVEDCVRLAPAQYQWGYNRFKVRKK